MPYTIATSSTTTSGWDLDRELDRDIWSTWNTGTTGGTTRVVVRAVPHITASSMDRVVWATWLSSSTNSVLVQTTQQVANNFQPRTEAQRAADREAFIQAEGERAKAREKAEVLLRECLNPKQVEELSLHGHFHLETIAKSGERRRYRIERGRSRNVRQVSPDGRILKTLCMHPVMNIPDADTMLAQKLYLEAAEDDFLAIANHS